MPASAVSLVTGSARGLGLAVARRLRERGDRVHVVHRNPDHAGPLGEEFGERVHVCDLEREADAAGLVERVVAADGGLDHLVHVVGEFVSGPLSELRAEDLRRMWENNVMSSAHVMTAARSALRRSSGSAVFFACAGLDGLRARRETAAYAAAKSALVVLARSFALEEAPHGVRVNLVSPGIVPHADAAEDTHDPRRHERIPLGRPGTPEEIAAAVEFLCSERASYTTGCDLSVAGGWLL